MTAAVFCCIFKYIFLIEIVSSLNLQQNDLASHFFIFSIGLFYDPLLLSLVA